MLNASLIPWLDPEVIITAAGPWAVLVVCLIVFAETGLLVGFLLPGDTLLIMAGLLSFSPGLGFDVWWVALFIGAAAFIGGEVGYLIGHRGGPRVFERKESGLFSVENVRRTNAFFERFGPIAVVVARFVPVIRTFAPVAAGVAHMNYRRYSLYNFVGAMLWGVGLVFAGYFLGYVPPIANFVRDYIDLILVAAVALTVIPTVWHYLAARRKARESVADGETARTDAEGAAELRLDSSVFGKRRR
ncbi:DedA family protein [Paramicrobacterium agarici]|uniref:Membrane-associated protein n=1 Tax=Paramicrobacterium agarici TaxID=630514 RepID=A0A2A9DZ16_9MICO|nr:VTT domain-containing protein [Microbacterium agarici]PFG31616.1 membrane-associated protein [Microbacterium agarici]